MISNDQKLGVIRHGLSFIGGILVWDGKADQGQVEQIVGAVMMIVSIVWSVMQKKGPATAILPAIFLLLAIGSGIIGCKNVPVIPFDPIQDVITNTVQDVVVPPVLPPVIVPVPATNTPANDLPFAPGDCEFHRIAADILDWPETRTLTIAKFSRDKLWSSCSGSDWRPTAEISGVTCQGCFIIAVEQPDKSIIIGTFDFNRAKHQTMKGLENLHDSEHSFFNLRSGCRIWWATAGLCRDTRRNVKERTNFVPGVWP